MKNVYLIFGEQGSGKTTQGKLLAEKLNVPYFEAGQLLRDLSDTDTEKGIALERIMASGALAPNSYLEHIFNEFIEHNNTENGFVTDGFPRNIDQVELLVELVKRHAWSITAIYIVVSDRVAVERLSHRVTVVDGQEVRRDDDKPEIVQKRLHNFRDQTLPVINWIGNNYKLIKINGEQSIEGVTEDISKAIDNG